MGSCTCLILECTHFVNTLRIKTSRISGRVFLWTLQLSEFYNAAMKQLLNWILHKYDFIVLQNCILRSCIPFIASQQYFYFFIAGKSSRLWKREKKRYKSLLPEMWSTLHVSATPRIQRNTRPSASLPDRREVTTAPSFFAIRQLCTWPAAWSRRAPRRRTWLRRQCSNWSSERDIPIRRIESANCKYKLRTGVQIDFSIITTSAPVERQNDYWIMYCFFLLNAKVCE